MDICSDLSEPRILKAQNENVSQKALYSNISDKFYEGKVPKMNQENNSLNVRNSLCGTSMTNKHGLMEPIQEISNFENQNINAPSKEKQSRNGNRSKSKENNQGFRIRTKSKNDKTQEKQRFKIMSAASKLSNQIAAKAVPNIIVHGDKVVMNEVMQQKLAETQEQAKQRVLSIKEKQENVKANGYSWK